MNGLNKLTLLSRAKRFHDGALSLNSPAPKFDLNEVILFFSLFGAKQNNGDPAYRLYL